LRIVLAPDSFKGSLGAAEVCEAFRKGVSRVAPDAECVVLPLADGGEGTTEALCAATGGTIVEIDVTGPLPSDRVRGKLGRLGGGDTAVLEMASASGLALVPPDKRNPLLTTSRGAGELIQAALDAGARHLIIGIGGSATNDLGTGLAQALGVRFFRSDGGEIIAPMRGEWLEEIGRIDVAGLHPAIQECKIEVACDVDNPLLGPRGAAAVYGPQKGATPEIVARLESGAARAIDIIEAATGRRARDFPGSGAAGGLGAGLLAFLGATLRPGIGIVLDATRFVERIRGADLVLTGEGRIDGQTAHGKTISGVARAAKECGVPVVAIVGSIGEGAEFLYSSGLTSVFPLVPGPVTLEEAMANASAMIADTAERVLRLLLAARR